MNVCGMNVIGHDRQRPQKERLLYFSYHMFSGLTGRRVEEGFQFFAEKFPAMETLNGAMPVSSNRWLKVQHMQATELAV